MSRSSRRPHRFLSAARALVAAAVLALAPAPRVHADQHGRTVGPSGLPLPRFVSLASERVNMRTGPGKEFPVRWVYVRAGLPVKIVAEADVWRKIIDPDGETGWVHSALLSGRRTVVVRGEILALKRRPDPEALTLARVEPGVIAELQTCRAAWCLVEVADLRGWLPRARLWGVDPAR